MSVDIKFNNGSKTYTLEHWFVGEGTAVERGQDLAMIRADDVLYTIRAPMSGIFLAKRVSMSENFEADDTIGLILSDEEAGDLKVRKKLTYQDRRIVESLHNTGRTHRILKQPRHIKATPGARRVARSEKVDLLEVTGTGPDHRIQVQDVIDHIKHEQLEMKDKEEQANEPVYNLPLTPLAEHLVEEHNLDASKIPAPPGSKRLRKNDVERYLANPEGAAEAALNDTEIENKLYSFIEKPHHEETEQVAETILEQTPHEEIEEEKIEALPTDEENLQQSELTEIDQENIGTEEIAESLQSKETSIFNEVSVKEPIEVKQEPTEEIAGTDENEVELVDEATLQEPVEEVTEKAEDEEAEIIGNQILEESTESKPIKETAEAAKSVKSTSEPAESSSNEVEKNNELENILARLAAIEEFDIDETEYYGEIFEEQSVESTNSQEQREFEDQQEEIEEIPENLPPLQIPEPDMEIPLLEQTEAEEEENVIRLSTEEPIIVSSDETINLEGEVAQEEEAESKTPKPSFASKQSSVSSTVESLPAKASDIVSLSKVAFLDLKSIKLNERSSSSSIAEYINEKIVENVFDALSQHYPERLISLILNLDPEDKYKINKDDKNDLVFNESHDVFKRGELLIVDLLYDGLSGVSGIINSKDRIVFYFSYIGQSNDFLDIAQSHISLLNLTIEFDSHLISIQHGLDMITAVKHWIENIDRNKI